MAMMEPRIVFSNDRVTLWHGDCRDVLPMLSGVDAVVADPPYGQNLLTKTKTLGGQTFRERWPTGRNRIYAPMIGDDKAFNPVHLLGFKNIILWGANWYCNKLPPTSRWLVWDKRNGTNPNNMADCEIAWTNLSGPNRLFHHRWMGMIRDSERQVCDRIHPTQKPLALMKWCLAFIPKDAIILDPYAGSGSTMIAALELGRKSIGIELDERWVEVARKRLARWFAQGRIPFSG